MYTKIQEMKAQGFSKNKTASYLNIHRDTVNRYWNMTADEYREYSEKIKRISVIKNKNHDRDTSSPIDKIQSELDEQLDHNASDFLVGIRADKPRYARDQFRLLQSLLDKYGKEKLINAAKFCTENRLFSANTARDFLEFSELPKPEIRQIDNQAIPVDKPEYHVTVQKRSLDVYAKAGDM